MLKILKVQFIILIRPALWYLCVSLCIHDPWRYKKFVSHISFDTKPFTRHSCYIHVFTLVPLKNALSFFACSWECSKDRKLKKAENPSDKYPNDWIPTKQLLQEALISINHYSDDFLLSRNFCPWRYVKNKNLTKKGGQPCSKPKIFSGSMNYIWCTPTHRFAVFNLNGYNLF